MASGICYLIFIGSLTVRFDLSDYELLVIGQVKLDTFGVTIAKSAEPIRFKHFVIDTITSFILIREKFLQFDWLKAVVFQLNMKYLRVKITNLLWVVVYRGYYTVARRYEFYFLVAKQYFTHSLRSFVKYCFCHEKIKFISSSRRVMFFLLHRQNDIDKIIEGHYQNYVIDKLKCEIMENKPLGSRM